MPTKYIKCAVVQMFFHRLQGDVLSKFVRKVIITGTLNHKILAFLFIIKIWFLVLVLQGKTMMSFVTPT